MNRWLLWLPFGLLTLGVGLFYLRLGWIAATISEGDVIERYAERYVQAQLAADPESLASERDCVAVPSDERGVWIVVICGTNPCDLRRYSEYHVNRIGGVVHGGDRACPDAALRNWRA